VKVAAYQRRKMYALFMERMLPGAADTILDVGVTSDRSYDHSNYLEAWYPHKRRLTALGIDDANFLEDLYPGLTFIQGDGRDLPFDSGAFDFVHSSAVLEHVGSEESQAQFLRELWRVSRKGIFVTTPNRWFPIEFHTVMPLVHWLPMPAFRAVLNRTGKGFFAQEENLNLMSRGTLARAARSAGIGHFKVTSVPLLGWPTNLILVATKS
jgi:hypothetical protein